MNRTRFQEMKKTAFFINIDHPLWTTPGVLLTPHTAGYARYLDERRYEIILDNCRRFLATTAAQPCRQGPLVLNPRGTDN